MISYIFFPGCLHELRKNIQFVLRDLTSILDFLVPDSLHKWLTNWKGVPRLKDRLQCSLIDKIGTYLWARWIEYTDHVGQNISGRFLADFPVKSVYTYWPYESWRSRNRWQRQWKFKASKKHLNITFAFGDGCACARGAWRLLCWAVCVSGCIWLWAAVWICFCDSLRWLSTSAGVRCGLPWGLDPCSGCHPKHLMAHGTRAISPNWCQPVSIFKCYLQTSTSF